MKKSCVNCKFFGFAYKNEEGNMIVSHKEMENNEFICCFCVRYNNKGDVIDKNQINEENICDDFEQRD